MNCHNIVFPEINFVVCKENIIFANKRQRFMKRYILAMAFIIMCAVTCPLTVAAWDYDPDIQEQMDADNINITVNGMTLNVAGASGQVLEVVSLTGRKVASVKIESQSQRVELNIPKGCYILKIGKVVRKVSLR